MSKKSFKIDNSLVLRPQTSAPLNPEDGEIYYDSTLKTYRQYKEGVWENLGSGAGDMTALESRLEARLRDSYFEWLTPNVFLKHENTRVNPLSTATYNTANKTYQFTSIGSILTSTEHFGGRFLSVDLPLTQLELSGLWNIDDPLAVWEVSVDGGNEYEAVNMEKVGSSYMYRGIIDMPDPATLSTLHEYAVTAADSTLELDATNVQSVARPVSVTDKQKWSGLISLYLNVSGTPSGTGRVKLVLDNSGAPSSDPADIYSESELIDFGDLSSGNIQLDLTMQSILTVGSYWLVFETDAAYKAGIGSGTVSVRTDASSPADLTSYQWNGTAWSDSGEAQCYKITGFEYSLIVRITSGTAGAELAGYGVFYGGGELVNLVGLDATQRFVFSGSENRTQFEVTKFLPEPERVKVYVNTTGQVFKYPTFRVSGNIIEFDSGTFNSPGVEYDVWVDQSEGGAFDNSDQNALLLAENGLGSVDSTIDRSSPSVGIKGRSADNTMFELVFTDDGGLEVYEVTI